MVRSVQAATDSDTDLPIDVAIVEAVAAAEGVDETTLPPLGHVIDADALESLLDGPVDDSVTVDFEYAGHRVEVAGDRTVSLVDIEQ